MLCLRVFGHPRVHHIKARRIPAFITNEWSGDFDIESLKQFNTLAAPGTVLKKLDKGKEILAPAKQTQCGTGVGKGMHMMQYSQPDTYNAVCHLVTHDTCNASVLWPNVKDDEVC
jgi:hypothetical protein